MPHLQVCSRHRWLRWRPLWHAGRRVSGDSNPRARARTSLTAAPPGSGSSCAEVSPAREPRPVGVRVVARSLDTDGGEESTTAESARLCQAHGHPIRRVVTVRAVRAAVVDVRDALASRVSVVPDAPLHALDVQRSVDGGVQSAWLVRVGADAVLGEVRRLARGPVDDVDTVGDRALAGDCRGRREEEAGRCAEQVAEGRGAHDGDSGSGRRVACTGRESADAWGRRRVPGGCCAGQFRYTAWGGTRLGQLVASLRRERRCGLSRAR